MAPAVKKFDSNPLLHVEMEKRNKPLSGKYITRNGFLFHEREKYGKEDKKRENDKGAKRKSKKGGKLSTEVRCESLPLLGNSSAQCTAGGLHRNAPPLLGKPAAILLLRSAGGGSEPKCEAPAQREHGQ